MPFLLCPIYTVCVVALKRWRRRRRTVSLCRAKWSFESTSSSQRAHHLIARRQTVEVRQVWKKTNKKTKNDAGRHKLNWVVRFLVSIGSYRSKIYKFDGKRLFSEAGAGFQSCRELIAQPVKPRYAKDGIKNVINIRAHFVLCRRMR